MAYLPTTEAAVLATRDDIDVVRAEIQEIRSEVKDVRSEIRAVNERLDRLFLTIAAGLIATVGALVTAFFFA